MPRQKGSEELFLEYMLAIEEEVRDAGQKMKNIMMIKKDLVDG